ncbi:MAG: YjjG family noncanonical pyrimidine nucleotidase [Flavobacteriales bacterium]|nr:YjjG family noncanonical pyrimidine nucleotidase [Flavobacteriales bacterium]
MRRYRHIFFDLDHTLWDFRTNSRATLEELHRDEGLRAMGVTDLEAFIATYEEVNTVLWGRYERGRLHRDVLRVLRFTNTLRAFGIRDEKLAVRLGRAYLERCPLRTALMPGALELLHELRPTHGLHIITNGFDEVQRTKLTASGIAHLFGAVITSERAGARKPDPRIFAKALHDAGAEAQESLMVGDDREADMAGARGSGLDHAHFAAETEPDPLATYRIRDMHELRAILC